MNQPTAIQPPTPTNAEEKLGHTQFNVDAGNPHFTVDPAKCKACASKPCLWICPAENFRLDEKGDLVVSWEGCIECGAVDVICHQMGNGAITWHYPRGGFGVRHAAG
ncbi:MAG: Ferredoxin-like protein FixX [Phycisphaerae bacterium]|nr:Ferredoxin-like protein FixX [Phycisphaerae bacterium]